MTSLALVVGALLFCYPCLLSLPVSDSQYNRGVFSKGEEIPSRDGMRNARQLRGFPVFLFGNSFLDPTRPGEETKLHHESSVKWENFPPTRNLNEILYGRRSQQPKEGFQKGLEERQYRKRSNFSECFWKYCV